MGDVNLGARKAAELQCKLRAIDQEFTRWIEAAENGAYQRHHSQITGVVGPLRAIRERVGKDLKDKTGDNLLTAAQSATHVLLGVFRVWEFFRQKWIQRNTAELKPYLDVADEFAWRCYDPVLKKIKVRRPPLVYLNGGVSPFALNRDHEFHIESENDGELDTERFQAILRKLPFPVIGVPWHQLEFWPELLVVAHEVGHAVESDLQLEKEVEATILKAIGTSPRQVYWRAWRAELFADAYGCAAVGPASAAALADFLSNSRTAMESSIPSAQEEHPPALIRIEFNQAFLEAAKLPMLGGWTPLDQGPLKLFAKDTKAVAVALQALLKKHIKFTAQQWKSAGDRAELARTLTRPDSQTTDLPMLVASLRRLFEISPDGWNRPDHPGAPTPFSEIYADLQRLVVNERRSSKAQDRTNDAVAEDIYSLLTA